MTTRRNLFRDGLHGRLTCFCLEVGFLTLETHSQHLAPASLRPACPEPPISGSGRSVGTHPGLLANPPLSLELGR
jgi:hypothetical protein